MTRLYDALFRPASVALVGASDSPGKSTARPLEYLRKHGWAGDLFPVNAVRETVLGEKAWRSLDDLPVVPEHVFILTGADGALEVAGRCVELGVGVVTLMADGFVEAAPDGPRRRRALADLVAKGSTRFLGPSSLGLASLATGLSLTANAAFGEADLPVGDVFVASQSGSAMGALLSRGKDIGIGFHSLVSTGGELDLALGEICAATVDEPGIASYALFLENLHGSDDLRMFARAAADRGKPVIAYKLGRSTAGAELTVSHTGALAGEDVVAGALLRDIGIARVVTFDALLEGQHLARAARLTQRGLRRPRVGVVSTTGGGGAMVVDCLAVAGAEPSSPSPETVERLGRLGIVAGGGALVDLTLTGTRYEVMKAALDVMLTAPEFDAVIAVPGSSARFHPDLAVKPIADSAQTGTPLVSFVMPSAPEALELLRASGVSAFRSPESCADAIVAIFGRRQPVMVSSRRVATGASRVLDEVEGYAWLDGLGIAHAPCAVVSTSEAVTTLPVPGPVVVKVLSGAIPHKSDVGGVVLGITDAEELSDAVERIVSSVASHLPGMVVDHCLVQSMVTGLGEVLVGYRHDPDVGPVIVLAAGGLLAELYEDRSVRTAPVDHDEAMRMIEDVVALKPLGGYRGSARGDFLALADTIVTMSSAGDSSAGAVLEAEINPLIVRAEGLGVVAVDALVRMVDGDADV